MEPQSDRVAFRPNGPVIEGSSLRLLIPCELSSLAACLARLPQDKKRMGFRLTVDFTPVMLRPSGNFATAKISRRDKKRVGWAPTRFWVTHQGIAIATSLLCCYGKNPNDLPTTFKFAQVLALFATQINEKPSSLADYSEDSEHCICCGKALTVEQSRFRNVGPECVKWLDYFLGQDKTVAEIESPQEAA